MKANRRNNTKPEMLLRSELHKLGCRFRKDFPILAGTRRVRPDVVFTKKKIAIFIDGCFWHYCDVHGHIPKRNCKYWEDKLKRNVERDTQDSAALSEAGWAVLRLWEHESVSSMTAKVTAAIKRTGLP